MAWAPSYASLTDFKSFARIPDEDDDAELTLALEGASRAIDGFTYRQFGVEGSAVARYYAAHFDVERRRYVVLIDDLMTTTSLVVKSDTAGDGTFATTLTINTDFRLAPPNAAADVRPWTVLVAAPGVHLSCHERSVEIAAKWGWTAVPDVIEQATMLQALRIFKRRDAPFGVAGSPELGSELRLLARLDPDVQVLVSPYRRMWAAA
jgi:hypothetical protein